MVRGVSSTRRAPSLRAQATRLKILLRNIGKDDGPVIEPVREELARGAHQLEAAIQYNIMDSGLFRKGDLLDSVAKVRRAGGLEWKVGFFRRGAVRKWRLAGWRAHMAEFGTEHAPTAHRPVGRAAQDNVPEIADRVEDAVDEALRAYARRSHGQTNGQ